jgi:putative hemolysin
MRNKVNAWRAILVLIIPLTLASPALQASADPVYLTLSEPGQSVRIPFYTVNGWMMNDVCKKKIQLNNDCKAYGALRRTGKRRVLDPDWRKKFASPAEAFCKQTGGVPLTLKDPAKNEMSMCAFEDQSIVSAWALYQGSGANP